ncbi:hypothetical protein EJ08DRAFT_105465 [Tothia fuscella]|uniref:Heterokaryon incompatibility domain-containing protein n=1 Tax=Tothia fuscella TaxID=1048955 RepID=A0A9P4U1L3_9PEZI|nr:hypothetical protein EJ08DRAFT_105465 [Tothia fuscella]
MRHADRARMLWADSICIDQGNKKEQGHQVDNMLRIYQGSQKVLVWLGRDTQKYAQIAVYGMKKFAQIVCDARCIDVNSLNEIDNLYDVIPTTDMESRVFDDSRGRAAVAGFVDHSWFKRLWVIQEVGSGSGFQVLCGSSEVPFDVVALTAEYLDFTNKLNTLGIKRCIFMRYRPIISDLSENLLILHNGRYYNASLRSDHVYGMLGLPIMEPLARSINADYSKPFDEVFLDVAKILIPLFRNLDILSYVQHKDGINEKFPTWVPQWDKRVSRNPSLNYLHVKCNAGKTSGLGAIIETTVLRCGGVCIDTVKEREDIDHKWFRNSKATEATDSVLKEHPLIALHSIQKSQRTDGSSTLDERIVAYARAICPVSRDKNVLTESEKWLQDFLQYMIRLLDQVGDNTTPYFDHCDESVGQWEAFERGAYEYMWGRSLFWTENELVGSGPNHLREGDKICVLFGGRIPYILRPKGGFYQYVGEAYLDGFMEGKAIDMLEKGELVEEVFEIH